MTVATAPAHGADADVPRRIMTPVTPGDRVFRGVLRTGGIAVLVITGLIAIFLVVRATKALKIAGWSFFTKQTWIPSGNQFGIATILPNGIIIALIALVIAVPIAFATAIFISEYAPHRVRRAMIALIDLMAAIPSIIYALWGVYFVLPRVLGTFRWISENLSWIPFFKVRGAHDESAYVSSPMVCGVVVSVLVIPIIASVSREVFSQAPAGEREAAFALGATRWQMVRTVVIPFARGGMIGAVLLGFGRALGETIVVTLLNSPTPALTWRVLEAGSISIPSLIAAKYGDGTPLMLSSLIAAGLVLFVITLIFNALASIVVARSRSGAQTI